LKTKKICIVITTRGNYAKMKTVAQLISQDPQLELQMVVGGGAILSKYGDMVQSLENNGIEIKRHVHFLVEGENPVTMAKSAGLAIGEFSTVFDNLKPDMVLVIADRFECLPLAMAASYMNIPVAHVEGGEVSGSIDESVRHAITKMSHLHFPATADAARRIERMGEAPETIFTVGATSLDAIVKLDLKDLSPLMDYQVVAGVGNIIDLSKPYLVVIQHPVTTEYRQNNENINQTIEAIDSQDIGVIWLWPNMDAGSDGISKGIREYRELKSPDHVHFFKSLPIELYAPLLAQAKAIVGNSSSGIRESAFLGVPCINIGTRQNNRQRGINVIDVDYDAKKIAAAIQTQLGRGHYPSDTLYGDGKASVRIVEAIKTAEVKLQKQITY
jgi:UDP-hydrolysing UDP-N-acetyl-D-glucosamine 2-epimerase